MTGCIDPFRKHLAATLAASLKNCDPYDLSKVLVRYDVSEEHSTYNSINGLKTDPSDADTIRFAESSFDWELEGLNCETLTSLLEKVPVRTLM